MTKGNTTNLFNHLEHNHITKYEEFMAQKRERLTNASTKQLSLTQAFTNAAHNAKDSRRWKEITDAIAYYIMKDMDPVATEECSGLKHLFKSLNKRYAVSSQKYFSQTAVPNMYEICCEKEATELKSVQYFAATSDLWSSTRMEPYLSLTLHYMDDEWNLHNRYLKTAYFPDDDTSEIAQGLRNMLSA